MRIAVISDTHLPRDLRQLPEACVERIAVADLLLHAGDFSTLEVLRELEAIGPPVAGVHGNVASAELRRLLPAERIVDAEGMGIASASGRTSWSSATRTCRSTSRRRTASRSSTRGAQPNAAERRATRWG